MLRALIETARPRQWIKNLFVGVPLIFAKRLGDPTLLVRSVSAVALFCALSSAVYFWNDVVDLEKDRAHPRKRLRPIPSGRLPVPTARLVAALLGAGGLLGAWLLDPRFGYVAGLYLLQNVAYSLWWKRVVYLDVLSIAAGFLLRVVGGGYATNVWVSHYLLICTGLLACFLGFGKRANELAVSSSGNQAAAQRPALQAYRADILRVLLMVTGSASLAAYALYTRAPHTVAFFGTGQLIWTTPFAAYGLFRFAQLVWRDGKSDSPTEEMLRDVPFMLNFVACAAVVVALIYAHH